MSYTFFAWMENYFADRALSFADFFFFPGETGQKDCRRAQCRRAFTSRQPTTVRCFPDPLPRHLGFLQEGWSLVLDSRGGGPLQGLDSLGGPQGWGAPLHLSRPRLLCCQWWHCQRESGKYSNCETPGSFCISVAEKLSWFIRHLSDGLYILFKIVKSPIRHLGLAIRNVRHVRWFSWTLLYTCPANVRRYNVTSHWLGAHTWWSLKLGQTYLADVYLWHEIENYKFYITAASARG